jgi:cytochrome b561
MSSQNGFAYDRVAKTLHWLIGTLVILLMFSGNFLEQLPEAEKPAIAMIHSGVGSTILLLMIVRLIWRLGHPPPPLLPAPAWQQAATRIVHWGFYGLVILLPVFGIAQSLHTPFEVAPFGLFTLTGAPNEGFYDIFHELHEMTATLVIAVLLVHVSAALYHHLINKNAVLKRMTWGQVGPSE